MPQASDCQIRCLPPTSGDIRRHSDPTDTRPCIHEEPARPPSARREPEALSARASLPREPSPLLRRALATNACLSYPPHQPYLPRPATPLTPPHPPYRRAITA